MPKVVTQRCLQQDLNPRPTDRKPKCLTRCTTAHIDVESINRQVRCISTSDELFRSCRDWLIMAAPSYSLLYVRRVNSGTAGNRLCARKAPRYINCPSTPTQPAILPSIRVQRVLLTVSAMPADSMVSAVAAEETTSSEFCQVPTLQTADESCPRRSTRVCV